jgi:hypothetical protein
VTSPTAVVVPTTTPDGTVLYFINNRATSGVTKCASDGIKVAVTVSGGSGGGTGECVPVACRVDGPPTNTLTLDNRCCSIADGHGYKASCAAGFTYYQWGSASTNGEWKGDTCDSPSTGTCCVASSSGSPPAGATLPSSATGAPAHGFDGCGHGTRSFCTARR